jgi:hypothetical protein
MQLVMMLCWYSQIVQTYENGAEDRNRTYDLFVTSELLYQLSYFGKKFMIIVDSLLLAPAIFIHV